MSGSSLGANLGQSGEQEVDLVDGEVALVSASY